MLRTTTSDPAGTTGLDPCIFRTRELGSQGWTRSAIELAVRSGRLIRVRRGVFASADAPPEMAKAASLGGRLTCVSLLRLVGVFVLDDRRLHCHMPPNAARLPRRGPQEVAHWRDLSGPALGTHAVGLRDAILQSVLCQSPRATIATLDSLLHLGLIDLEALRDIFAELPARCGVLLRLVDGRAESGPETLVRLILRGLDCSVELQVWIDDVGRVDFLVDGWLIIECDSRAHHGGWEQQVRDRERDLEAAARGYVTVRVIASDAFERQDWLRRQLQRVIAHRPSYSPRTTQAPHRRTGETRRIEARIRDVA